MAEIPRLPWVGVLGAESASALPSVGVSRPYGSPAGHPEGRQAVRHLGKPCLLLHPSKPCLPYIMHSLIPQVFTEQLLHPEELYLYHRLEQGAEDLRRY